MKNVEKRKDASLNRSVNFGLNFANDSLLVKVVSKIVWRAFLRA